ncbi:hypothetical protein H4J38_04315 [Colwellia sp. BRX10-3]|uniref:hypothetical protein n=1 Tax=Colwellia sp. BRX10-3 TaxID=2759844 RepID=UPI0015F5DB4A|nr:hypothetical protein [Colwellia sp. BRX10-3]MBA6390003.1 hypothetical protein [Colwellia sp. BRX10-3]
MFSFFKGWAPKQPVSESDQAHLIQKYKLTKQELNCYIERVDAFDVAKLTREFYCSFRNVVEAYIRIQLGFKKALFDPIDEPYVWSNSKEVSEEFINDNYYNFGEQCRYHGVSDPKDIKKCYMEVVKLVNSPAGNIRYTILVEYIVLNLISRGDIKGTPKPPSTTESPILTVTQELMLDRNK